MQLLVFKVHDDLLLFPLTTQEWKEGRIYKKEESRKNPREKKARNATGKEGRKKWKGYGGIWKMAGMSGWVWGFFCLLSKAKHLM